MLLTDELRGRLANVRLLAMDVDGVLTDGTLGYSERDEIKRFHVADGLGLTALRLMGYTTAWISGRESAAVARRAAELKIPYLLAGARDKAQAVRELMAQTGHSTEKIAYIGDDWNDLPAFAVTGVRIAVLDAASEVLARADGITQRAGGQGAVREVCDALLEAAGRRDAALDAYLSLLREETALKKRTVSAN